MRTGLKRLMTVGAAGAMAISLAVTPAAQADPAPRPDPRAAIAATPAALSNDLVTQLESANRQLSRLGFAPFLWPTAAVNCSQVPGTPLGVVPAVAGAMSGPHTPGLGYLALQNAADPMRPFDFNAVKSGEVLYGFFPSGIVKDSANKSGMNVGWFNVNTLQGGFVPMGSLSDAILTPIRKQVAKLPAPQQVAARAALAAVENVLNRFPQAGSRAAVVDTGRGMVLSLVVGSVTHSSGTCYFLPTVGIQDVD